MIIDIFSIKEFLMHFHLNIKKCVVLVGGSSISSLTKHGWRKKNCSFYPLNRLKQILCVKFKPISNSVLKTRCGRLYHFIRRLPYFAFNCDSCNDILCIFTSTCIIWWYKNIYHFEEQHAFCGWINICLFIIGKVPYWVW